MSLSIFAMIELYLKSYMSKQNNYWKHLVPPLSGSIRIADYCGPVFSILGSKSAAKKAIAGGRLLLNGKPAVTADFVKKGDLIELRGVGIQKIKKLDVDLNIVYEDDFLIVIQKPGGIAVNGNRYKTVENALSDFNRNNPLPDALPRPIAVHRIDVPTSGLVMLAKTKSALIQLSKAFQHNQVKKEYVAIVHGAPPQKGSIDSPIDGKDALTEFECLQTVRSRVFETLSLVKLLPQTGRTHQLRLHLKDQGHLIVGDKMYADGIRTILGKGLLLCAVGLRFIHPQHDEKIDIRINPPAKFEKLLQRENDRFSR
jgi:RluA family pseudouridine synthase